MTDIESLAPSSSCVSFSARWRHRAAGRCVEHSAGCACILTEGSLCSSSNVEFGGRVDELTHKFHRRPILFNGRLSLTFLRKRHLPHSTRLLEALIVVTHTTFGLVGFLR